MTPGSENLNDNDNDNDSHVVNYYMDHYFMQRIILKKALRAFTQPKKQIVFLNVIHFRLQSLKTFSIINTTQHFVGLT
jgi:hypothetical protein